jgi:hypothetical protein
MDETTTPHAAGTDPARGVPACERTHRVAWFTGRLGEVLDDVLGVEGDAGLALSLLGPEETATSVVEVDRAIARLTGLKVALLAHAADVDVAGHATPVATSPGGWLSHATRTPAPVAHAQTRLAGRLATERTLTGAALRAGACDERQAGVIVRAVDALPAHVDPELRAEAEHHLLRLATEHDATALAKLATHLHEVIDPDGAEAALAARLAAEEEDAAHAAARCRIRTTADGRTRATLDLPRVEGDAFRALIDAIASPTRPGNQDQAQQPERVDDAGFVDDPEAPHRRISRDENRGRAFCELLHRIPAKALPGSGGALFTVVVTMTLQTLLGGLGPGVLDTGTEISPGEARRLAARHGVIPAVLDTTSEVLDLGRTARLHTKAQRTALRVQHSTCTVDGCTVPAAWCHAHHRNPWAAGGRTNVRDGTLVCGGHHRKIHHPAYTTTYDGAVTHLTRIRR